MRKAYFIIAILLTSILVFSCQDDILNTTGYLRLEVNTNAFVNPQTKVASDYNPKQIAVQILDAANNIVDQTDDWETWSGKQLRLKPGNYTIKASSNGFNGMESGFDIPYYAGSEQITIESGKEKTANITCTLANVKVTVNFDPSFINAFKSATATITSTLANVEKLKFDMGATNKSAYFPVGNLSSSIEVTNKADKKFTQINEITNVKPRDHFILNYKIAETGSMGGVNVTVDETQTIYTFTFNVSTEVANQLAVKANAWSNFAYLEGEIISAKDELDPTNMSFEYKQKTSEVWLSAAAIQENGLFKATITNLTPNTQYNYRMVYKKGSNEISSNTEMVTTENATAIYNGGFEDWYGRINDNGLFGKTTTWYATSEDNYNSANGPFWDSSNPGTTTGAGALANINPTQSNTITIHSGSKSAELKSQYKVKFAAASLYTGSFGGLVGTDGAKINFGKPFNDRPTQLHGWFQYSTSTINYVGSNTPSSLGIIKGKTPDVCSIYIALTTKAYQVDNTKLDTFIDFENDTNVIAYGVLPLSESVPTNNQWKEFTIDLAYRNLTTKPTHIIIVCSASRYGDYFTGSTSSVMYVDDLELIYGSNPILK